MSEITSTISRLIQDACSHDATDVRSELFDRYMGEPYGDEKKGKSAFVSTDAADAVEAMLPDVLDVFTSAQDIMEFDPVGPDDEAAAKQETDVVSHMFWQKNRGFEILYVWIKEALMQQNSYVRFGWEDKERISIEEYADLTPDEALQVFSDIGSDFEIIEQDQDENGLSIKLRITDTEKKYVIECIPQEEFFHTPRWGKVSLDGIPCCGHKRKLKRGDLLAMGFSSDSVDEAMEDLDDYQNANRNDTEDMFEGEADTGDRSTEEVTVYEAYVYADMNDDDKAELLKVWAVGDGSTVLKWKDGSDAIEEVSHLPFAAITPYIIPHRHIGRSVVEQVDDIQHVNTVLMRMTLDNIYATQYGRPVIDEALADANTYNDLANPAQGSPIRYGGAIQYHMPPSVSGATLPLMEKFSDLREQRTGSTRYNQGLDAESLNKTASGMGMIMNASQKRNKLIARTFAETGMRDLFLGIHRDLRAGPLKDIAIKMRGEWVNVNPRTWRHRTDMTVNVGMGRGDRDEKRQGLMLISQAQEKLMAAGSRMVDERNLFNTAGKMAETFGFETVEPFFNDPATLPPEQPQPQQPDPTLIIAQAQIQNMQQETQRRAQADAMQDARERERIQGELAIKQAELEIKRAEQRARALKSAADVQKDAARLELDTDKAINADDLARDKMEMDAITGAFDREAQAYKSEPAVPYKDMGE